MSYTVIPGGVIDSDRFKKNSVGETLGCLAFFIWLAMIIPAFNYACEKHPPRVKADYIINGIFAAGWPVMWTMDIACDWCREPVLQDDWRP